MSNVNSEFYNVIKVNLEDTKKYEGQWYILRINPLPSSDDIHNVISDLLIGKDVVITSDCKLEHYNICNNYHIIPRELEEALKSINLKESKFKVLIREPKIGVLNNQPIVVVLDPVINFEKFPNHPHLNAFNCNLGIPTSLCYTDKYNVFSRMALDEKIIYAVQQSTFWLFKHMIWEELNKINYNDPWIGPSAAPVNDLARIMLINPNGKCFCNSKKRFRDCCLAMYQKKFTPYGLKSSININQLESLWIRNNLFEKEFRRYFLNVFDKYISQS